MSKSHLVTNNLQPQFEKFGISACEFWHLTWEEISRLTQGKTIDVTLKAENGEGKTIKRGVIYTELNIGGSRNRYFVQLDRETNCLLYEKADRIGQNIPEDIFGVKIDRELRDQIREGKQVTVKNGNKEYAIGIDLLSEGGFSVSEKRKEE